jgi:hypothetical protein
MQLKLISQSQSSQLDKQLLELFNLLPLNGSKTLQEGTHFDRLNIGGLTLYSFSRDPRTVIAQKSKKGLVLYIQGNTVREQIPYTRGPLFVNVSGQKLSFEILPRSSKNIAAIPTQQRALKSLSLDAGFKPGETRSFPELNVIGRNPVVLGQRIVARQFTGMAAINTGLTATITRSETGFLVNYVAWPNLHKQVTATENFNMPHQAEDSPEQTSLPPIEIEIDHTTQQCQLVKNQQLFEILKRRESEETLIQELLDTLLLGKSKLVPLFDQGSSYPTILGSKIAVTRFNDRLYSFNRTFIASAKKVSDGILITFDEKSTLLNGDEFSKKEVASVLVIKNKLGEIVPLWKQVIGGPIVYLSPDEVICELPFHNENPES